jgi:hypothetical protein
MSNITEVTVVGVFPNDVLLALSKPLNGVRFQGLPVRPPYVSDVMAAAYKNTPAKTILDFVHAAIKDYSAVVIVDEDVSDKTRVVRFTHGEWDVDTEAEDE